MNLSFSSHDESKEIAAILCPRLRSGSATTPVRVLATPDDTMFASAYQALRAAGGRKGLFASRNTFVLDMLLHYEGWFQIGRAMIELRSTQPIPHFWTGGGACKEVSAEECAALGGIFKEIARGSLPLGPDALVQIDITNIWNEVSPLLESYDQIEREAERKRCDQATLGSIPEHKGPPADPKVAAEIERLLSEIRSGKKSAASDEKA